MRILLYILAGLRAIVVFSMMAIFIGSYMLSTLIFPHTKKRALRLRRNFVKYVILPVLNIDIIVDGKPSSVVGLYVSNHRSFVDPMAICYYLEAFVIAKAEVANYPIINKGAELSGVIWVDRNNKDSRSATRDKMIEILESGYNILVFPEGTVSKDREPLPFRKGTFLEAAEHHIPVIPIAMEFKSQKDLWMIEKFVPQYFFQFSKWKTSVKLKFGEPIYSNDGEFLWATSEQWIKNEVSLMQKGWSEAFLA